MSAPLRLGLIGHPVSHSLSPILHQTAGRLAGVSLDYPLIDVAPEDVPTQIAALAPEGFRGVNVTVPHKEAVAQLIPRLTPTAAHLGAVNTVIVHPDGALEGDNTDVGGFTRALELGAPGFGRRKAVILGAGGSARAVAFAAAALGFDEIWVLNRTRARAEALIAALSLEAGYAATLGAWREAISGADLLVSTLPHSIWPIEEIRPQGVACAAPEAVICDIAYGGGRSPLLDAAAQAGRRPLDGLGMLVHQGLLAFARWTGRGPLSPADEAAVEVAVRQAASPGRLRVRSRAPSGSGGH